MRTRLLLAGMLLALVAPLAAQGPISTRSFTNGATGSDTRTLSYSGTTINVDLSAIAGAEVYRATLDPYIQPSQSRARYDIRDATGNSLPLLAPRYVTFDATAAVRAAVSRGSLTLTVVDPGQGFGNTISLDVLCNRPAPAPVLQVDQASARFRSGDTMVTFAEVNPPHGGATWNVGAYNAARTANGHDRAPKTRYRIYRSTVPFSSSDALKTAELIDEIMPMSGWNGHQYGFDPSFGGNDGMTIDTLPVDDLTPSAPGTGIYVNRYRGSTPQTAYYFVSHTVNGAEDFTSILQGRNATAGVVEVDGPGMTVLWKQNHIVGNWAFRSNVDMTLNYFVRWAAVPDWNVPSEAFNYRLGVPHDTAVPVPPLQITPHAWGEHYDTFQPWTWYEKGALMLNANLNYYNSYTGFHENTGTLRSYDDGTVQPYHHARVLDFVFSFVEPTYGFDRNRMILTGSSMGGAAGHFWGMRSGHLFAFIDSAVGNNIPAENITWEFESLGEWGPIGWQTRYSNQQLVRFGYPEIAPSDNYVVWDYFDNTQWLAANPQLETPHISFANAPNDPAIGWPQAWKTTQSMRETRRPMNFHWDQNGHAQWTETLEIEFRLDQSVPAFANCSLDDDLGSNPNNGAFRGHLNRYILWDVNTVVDRADRWQMDFHLATFSPQPTASVDITPRRLQNLPHAPGQAYAWFLLDGSTVRASGAARADAAGLFTIPGVWLTRTPRRLVVTLATEASLLATSHHLQASAGGSIDLPLDAGPALGGQIHIMLAGLSGSVPGTPLPGGRATLGLNWDVMTNLTGNMLNSVVFANFVGTFDGNGQSTAQLNLPPVAPSLAGQTLTFAACQFSPWNWASNAIGIEIVP